MTSSFPGLKPFKAWVYDSLAHRGKIAFSETLWGRKRRYPAYREELAENTKLERECHERGMDVYRRGGPRGRTDEEKAEIAARVERFNAGTLTEEDREAITRIGLYFHKVIVRKRNGDIDEEATAEATRAYRERFWQLRKSVSEVRRQAVNHVIQGSAADILKQIVIRLFWTCWERRERGWRFLFSIHDEVFTEIPRVDVTEATLDLIDDIMTKTVTLSVPLKADSVVSPRWMQEYRRHEWDFSACAPKAKEE
jgi:DNA polymerase I-like protein with 3'-5' exonuclease and polymerase domains